MLAGTIRNQDDQIWETFWTGGVSNPLFVIEQIIYLLFALLLLGTVNLIRLIISAG